MSNLGTISVTFLANTANFTGAVKVAAESLKTFGQAGQIAATASVPLQTTLGGVGSAAAMTTGNMTRLGQSTVNSAVNMKLLQAATAQGQTTLGAFGVNAGAAAGGMQQVASAGVAATKSTDSFTKVSQNAGESASAFKKRVEAGSVALRKQVPIGHEIKNSFKMMGDGSLQASRTITKSTNQSMFAMLSFKNMMGKIIHYITFSIGVQLVMGISRGLRALVDTMTDFQKEIVRTAGVAGRLGGAFRKTVVDIGAVSRELGRNTIFKASEAAHAMYDLASAGFDVAKAMSTVKNGVDTVGPILDYATAQQIELEDATASVSRALKMFDMDLDKSVSVVDTFTSAIANSFLTAEKLTDGLRYSGAMAHVLGISLNETVASLMTLSDAGLTGAQTGQRLNMIMTKLLKPTDKAKKTLASLGLTIEDISPQTHTLSQIFQTLQAAGFGAGEAANFFRARTAGAAAALISHADDMERYRLTLMGAEGITRELAEKTEETLWGSFKLLSAAVESLALSFGDVLMPLLQGLTDFITKKVVPVLEWLVSGIKTVTSILGPLVPLIKNIAVGIVLAAAAVGLLWIKIKLATLATRMWNTVLKANPIMLIVSIMGIAIGAVLSLTGAMDKFKPMMDVLGPIFGDIVKKVEGMVEWFGNLEGPIADIISIICPLVGIMRLLGIATKDVHAEERKLFVYTNKLRESSDKYKESLDELIIAYDGQIDAQEKVDDLMQDGISNTEELTVAQAELAKATENVTEKEEAYYASSAKLVKMIASLTEGLNLYTEAIGRVDVAEDKWEGKKEDRLEIEEDILKLEKELVDMTNRYGEGSQEVADVESELYKKHKDLLDIGEEIAELDAVREEEVKDLDAAYNKLSESEKTVADVETDLISNEEKLKNATIKMNKVQAKKNVLMSTRNNFERFFNERVNLLREAEQKLFDIELKIYNLRHGTVDDYKALFKALTGQGIVTDDLIETYKNMVTAEGNALKEHVEYVDVLNDLNNENRRSVTEWTEAYVAALGEGMTEDAAFADANEKMGMSIKDISQLTGDGIKEILEYAHAEHDANVAREAHRLVTLALASDMVESGQANTEVANTYGQIIKKANDAEIAEQALADASKGLDDNIYGLIGTTGRLLQYFLEFGEVGEDIGAITVLMAEGMGLTTEIGGDQASILKRLNNFYGINKASLEDYSHAEIVAALSAMKLAESMEGVTANTITKEDIVHELPIDDFSEFGNIAISVVNDLETEFDGLAKSIEILADEIGELELTIDRLADIQFPEFPEPPKSEWMLFWEQMDRGWENIKAGAGAEVPMWLRGLASIFPPAMLGTVVPDFINYAMSEAKHGLISLAGGVARTHGPTNALIGEAGAEAVVPLEGANRRFGKEILEEIIPKYFPDILRSGRASLQRGGEVNMPRTATDYLRNSEETTEIHIHGDINVYNPNDMDDFMDEFLEQLGKKRRLKI